MADLPSWWTDTLTVIRAPLTVDRYGNQTRDWGNATEHDEAGCKVTPVAGTDLAGQDDRAGLTRRRVVGAPLTADIQAADRIRWDGQVWEVEGEPLPWRSPAGGVDHLYVQLTRVEG